MRDLSTWRGLLPRELRDRVAFLFFVANLPLIFLFEFFVILPHYYSYFTWSFNCHYLFSLFLMANIYLNLYKLMTVDASGRKSDLPTVLKPDWKYCYVCQLNAPPRAYHCETCDECILKRDHHCIFSGCCVGYKNHRYYIIGVFYCAIAAFYHLAMQSEYIWDNLGGFLPETVWYLFVPQFALIFRFISFYQFLLSIIEMSLAVVFFISMYIFVMQMILIARGQTFAELALHVYNYDLGLKENFIDVFGVRWYLAWFNPFAESPQRSSGVKFHTMSTYEPSKNM